MRGRSIIWVAALIVSGCMLNNQSSTAKFREQVMDLNEEARWNRIDLAQARATPRYQPGFAAARAGWGKRLQVGDQDVLQLQIDKSEESAVSVVAISWYNLSDMTLRSTVVRQFWRDSGKGFAIDGETVVDGDPTIFADATAAPVASPASGEPSGK